MKGFQNYFERTLDHGEDLCTLFRETSREPTIQMPKTRQLPAGVTQLSAEYNIWNDEIKRCLERQARLKNNKTTVFSTILSQSSSAVVAKLEATTGYAEARCNYDVAWLINQAKDVCNQFENMKD